MRKILVVDDERNIVEGLKIVLRDYEVVTAYDGEEALEQYEKHKPNLILLDVMLPKLDGFEVCRRIRETDRHTPILMLTARVEETDAVFGFDLGADDYITKPFSNRMVQARVQANMRRLPEENAAPLKPYGEESGIIIDDERFDVIVNGKPCELTQREFELFKYLAASSGHIFSREELLRDVWGYDYFGDTRAVDVAVRRLRVKIEGDAAEPRHIMTKRNVGYYYSDGGEQ